MTLMNIGQIPTVNVVGGGILSADSYFWGGILFRGHFARVSFCPGHYVQGHNVLDSFLMAVCEMNGKMWLGLTFHPVTSSNFKIMWSKWAIVVVTPKTKRDHFLAWAAPRTHHPRN